MQYLAGRLSLQQLAGLRDMDGDDDQRAVRRDQVTGRMTPAQKTCLALTQPASLTQEAARLLVPVTSHGCTPACLVAVRVPDSQEVRHLPGLAPTGTTMGGQALGLVEGADHQVGR